MIFGFFVIAVCLMGCFSIPNPTQRVETTFTSKESEIKFIKENMDDRPIEMFWNASVLDKKSSDEETKNLLKTSEEKLMEFFEKSVEAGEYKNALKAARSIMAAKTVHADEVSRRSENIKDLLPKVTHPPSKSSGQMTDMIRGTVTVIVDMGIKVEHGRGFVAQSLGSGFFIEKSGYIITNYHVIESNVNPEYEGVSRVYIKLSGDSETRIPAEVVGWDDFLDLALLKTEVDAPFVFTLGSSEGLNPGDGVFAIGSPVGLENTVTSGIISRLDSNIFPIGPVFQVDAAINSGNSGGPLIDSSGVVRGIVFAGALEFQGLNFAIPVDYLNEILPQLYAGGKVQHGWFGIYGKTFRENTDRGIENNGVEVIYVMPGSTAAKSGIKPGDIICKINGEETNSLEELQFFLMKFYAETVFSINLTRNLDENGLPLAVPKEEDLLVLSTPRPKQPGYEIYNHDTLGNAMLPIFGMGLAPSSTLFSRRFSIKKILRSGVADMGGFSVNDPIEINRINFVPEKNAMIVEVLTKKQKSGYLDVFLTIGATLDSFSYF
ncbi:MAG: trypsin-like peptidase domain-containing protein [Spirochaetaceae bacterium]|nr:trypsin-like peptidase domain-containing protein [Spirochaetaceae bacterium]